MSKPIGIPAVESVKLIGILDAFEIETGRRPNPCTAWRWSTKGVKGVRLQVSFMGGSRLTTLPWVREFNDAVSRANMEKHEVATPMQTPRQQERNAEKAAKKLAKRLKPGAAK